MVKHVHSIYNPLCFDKLLSCHLPSWNALSSSVRENHWRWCLRGHLRRWWAYYNWGKRRRYRSWRSWLRSWWRSRWLSRWFWRGSNWRLWRRWDWGTWKVNWFSCEIQIFVISIYHSYISAILKRYKSRTVLNILIVESIRSKRRAS